MKPETANPISSWSVSYEHFQFKGRGGMQFKKQEVEFLRKLIV